MPDDSSGGVILPGADALGQRARVARDLPERLGVGVEDGRHDQRVLTRDRDADVDARVQLELAVAVGAVRARELAQRQRGRLDDEVVERRRRIVPGGRLELLAELDRVLHVDLAGEHELRRGRLGLRHPARDRLLQPRELLDRGRALAGVAPDTTGLGTSRSGSSSRRGLGLLPRLPPFCARRRLDVGLHDPAARPGALQRRQLDAQVTRHPARDRRRLHPAVAVVGLRGALGRRDGRRLLLALGLRRGVLRARHVRARRLGLRAPPRARARAPRPARRRRRPRRSARSSRRPRSVSPSWATIFNAPSRSDS